MTPIQEIERDLDWREAELAVLKILLANGNITEREKLVLFRAAWALLYAHYEGFCKFALTVYYDTIKKAGKKNRELAISTQVFALNAGLKQLRLLPASDLITQIRGFEAAFMDTAASFPDVDTQSNLWPNVLGDLLEQADMAIGSLPTHNRALATLVSRRNKIAHGERDMITEFNYYKTFDDAVRLVMYDVAIAIDEKLKVICP